MKNKGHFNVIGVCENALKPFVESLCNVTLSSATFDNVLFVATKLNNQPVIFNALCQSTLWQYWPMLQQSSDQIIICYCAQNTKSPKQLKILLNTVTIKPVRIYGVIAEPVLNRDRIISTTRKVEWLCQEYQLMHRVFDAQTNTLRKCVFEKSFRLKDTHQPIDQLLVI